MCRIWLILIHLNPSKWKYCKVNDLYLPCTKALPRNPGMKLVTFPRTHLLCCKYLESACGNPGAITAGPEKNMISPNPLREFLQSRDNTYPTKTESSTKNYPKDTSWHSWPSTKSERMTTTRPPVSSGIQKGPALPSRSALPEPRSPWRGRSEPMTASDRGRDSLAMTEMTEIVAFFDVFWCLGSQPAEMVTL